MVLWTFTWLTAPMRATGKDLCGEFDVQGFPTIKMINTEKDSVLDYNGAREAKALRSFVLYNMKKPFRDHRTQRPSWKP